MSSTNTINNINDESFVFLTHDAKKVAIEKSNECHNLKIQQLPIKTTTDSSHFIKFEAAKTLDNNINTWWKAVDIGHDGGEWVGYETVVPCYPVYADILFRNSNKVTCNFIVSGLDEESDPANKKEVNMFMGRCGPTKDDSTPVRALLSPIKTKVIKIKTIDYTIGDDKTHVYKNPEIQEVRLYGYVVDEFNPKTAILPPAFSNCPEGYYRDTKTNECTPRLERDFISPTLINSYSAINDDDDVTTINKNNDIRNLIKLPVNDKYSIKGKGSIIWQEFDHSDVKKYQKNAILEAIKLQAFQCPPRDYKLMVRIHETTGLKNPHDFDSKETKFQKIVDIQCGNGAPITIPLDGYNDSDKNTKKTVSVTMISTSNNKNWFSLVSFYAVGQREVLAPTTITKNVLPTTSNSNKTVSSSNKVTTTSNKQTTKSTK